MNTFPANGDYRAQAVPRTVTLGVGVTRECVNFQIISDTFFDGNETFQGVFDLLSLSGVGKGDIEVTVITIVDDDGM